MGCSNSMPEPGTNNPPQILNFDWEIDRSLLVTRAKIGAGSYGELHLGTYAGTPCAIKTLLPTVQRRHGCVQQFLDEIRLLSVLRHPNVVGFIGACTRPPEHAMILEYCVHGSLHDFLQRDAKHGVRVTMSLLLRFALDIARGVHYLHSTCGVVQRDLKARNILIDERLTAKVW